MHDTHQGSKVSEIIGQSFFTPPRINFILKNQIVIKEINADCSSADTGERSAFLFFNHFKCLRRTDGRKRFATRRYSPVHPH